MSDEEIKKANNKFRARMSLYIIIVATLVALASSSLTYYLATKKFEGYDFKVDVSTEEVDEEKAEKNIEAICESLKRFRKVVDQYYKWDVDENALLEGAIKGYIEGLGDEYTEYMTAEEWKKFEESALGNFEGIGIYMILNDSGNTEVVMPIEQSPAETAGIQAGDIVVEVDNENVLGKDLDIVSSKIKGKLYGVWDGDRCTGMTVYIRGY